MVSVGEIEGMSNETRIFARLNQLEERLMASIQDLQDAQAASDVQIAQAVKSINDAVAKLATMNATDAAVELVVDDIKRQTAALANAGKPAATSAPTIAPTAAPTEAPTSAPTSTPTSDATAAPTSAPSSSPVTL